MGRFIISRTAAGDRFLLQSDAGRTLALSRVYATLDACKKGLCSLMYYAPTVPVVDTTKGEHKPNPKFEITGGEGAFVYAMKSANGKAVITSEPFATKKACLRAIAMIRTGVVGAPVFFERTGGLEALVVDAMLRDEVAEQAPAAVGADKPARAPRRVARTKPEVKLEQPAEDAVDETFVDELAAALEEDLAALEEGRDTPNLPDDEDAEIEPMLTPVPPQAAEKRQAATPPTTKVPRRVHLAGESAPRAGARPAAVPTRPPKNEKQTSKGIFARIFKR